MSKKLFILFILPVFLFACKKATVDQAKIDHETILKYLADSSLVADSTSSGIYYIITKVGSGSQPNSSSYVTVNYKGYLINGTIFDQTAGTPAKFFLTQVITGWKQGIPLIKKGGKAKLIIPSGLGYGDKTVGTIPANSILIFDIELVDFQ